MRPTKVRDVVNIDDIDAFISLKTRDLDKDGEDKFIYKWFTSIFRLWIIKDVPMRTLVDERVASTGIGAILMSAISALPMRDQMMAAVHANIRLVNVDTLPYWAKEKMEQGRPLLWFDSGSVTFDLPHWIDWMRRLPKRDVQFPVLGVKGEVEAWDKQLAKQKLIASLSKGTEVVPVKTFEGTPYYLVRLTTETAYHNEGVVMHHCVKDYWRRRRIVNGIDQLDIYSFRQQDESTPIATIEIRRSIARKATPTRPQILDEEIVQVRGPTNKSVEEPLKTLLDKAFDELEWTRGNDEDYDGDDDEDDEDDEDEDDDREGVRENEIIDEEEKPQEPLDEDDDSFDYQPKRRRLVPQARPVLRDEPEPVDMPAPTTADPLQIRTPPQDVDSALKTEQATFNSMMDILKGM